MAATTLRAHLVINFKDLIGRNDCLNPTGKLLLQLNERNGLVLMLNEILIGIPLLETRVGLQYAGQGFWGSITINYPK